jgi:hypothetical protein
MLTKKIKNELVRAFTKVEKTLSLSAEGKDFVYALQYGEIINGKIATTLKGKEIIIEIDNEKPSSTLRVDKGLIIFRVNFGNGYLVATIKSWSDDFFVWVDSNKKTIHLDCDRYNLEYTYRPKKRPVKRKKRYKG